MGSPLDKPLEIGPLRLTSRLLMGSGRYASHQEMVACLEASGAELITVAVRRVNLDQRAGTSLLDYIDRERFQILPNTAGCYTVVDALRTARLARELLDTPLVKLEVIGDPRTLLPDPLGTVEATRILAGEGFVVMAYCSDDPRLVATLEQAGAAAVMPAGSPIGSGRGVANPGNIEIARSLVELPLIVDAGLGTASDVALAMELGADGVLLNSAVAGAEDPVLMARAMKSACRAGRDAYLAGRMPSRLHAQASSPATGLLGEALSF
jgi:thiazole synthase